MVGHEQVQKQRSALQSVGLLVQVEEVTAKVVMDGAVGLQSTGDRTEQQQEREQEESVCEPPWLHNRRVNTRNVQAEQANGDRSEAETQNALGNSDFHDDEDQGKEQDKYNRAAKVETKHGISFVTVSDTLVLRCNTNCSPEDLWRYV